MLIPVFSNKQEVKGVLEKAYCLCKLPVMEGVCMHITYLIHYLVSLVSRVDFNINLFLGCTLGVCIELGKTLLAIYISLSHTRNNYELP